MNDDENIRTHIEDGDRVQSKISSRYHGIAFTKNKNNQWLVRWDGGTTDVVHDNFLEREQ